MVARVNTKAGHRNGRKLWEQLARESRFNLRGEMNNGVLRGGLLSSLMTFIIAPTLQFTV